MLIIALTLLYFASTFSCNQASSCEMCHSISYCYWNSSECVEASLVSDVPTNFERE